MGVCGYVSDTSAYPVRVHVPVGLLSCAWAAADADAAAAALSVRYGKFLKTSMRRRAVCPVLSRVQAGHARDKCECGESKATQCVSIDRHNNNRNNTNNKSKMKIIMISMIIIINMHNNINYKRGSEATYRLRCLESLPESI